MNYDFKSLEFNKIIEILKEFTKTMKAKEYLENIKIPNDYNGIINLNNKTKDAYNNINKYSDIPLSNIDDVDRIIKRSTQNGILTAMELVKVSNFIDTTSNVINYFKTLSSLKIESNVLNNLVNNLELPKTLKTNINLVVDKDGNILDNASRDLFTIRKSLKSLENRLRAKLNELLISKRDMLTDNIIVERNYRMCLPVKVEFKNTFKGIIHDMSSSETTCYIEPAETIEISTSIDNFKEKEKKEINIILKNLSLLVSSEAELLINNFNILIELDVAYAKALMGIKNDYNEANIIEEPKFNLKKAKHPLIDKDVCIPIDINLGNKFNVIIITGPNTGGKTVALKTVGLLHLMAYVGMMVPASLDSSFGYFDNILADIGDEQSIEQSLSTFSSHMSKIINIINITTNNSLVLLDEVGSGTDPKEGSSLAISIIKYFKDNNSKVIATTHYSELKTYAYNDSDISNASVEFNNETLKPTYRLLIGIPGKSNAIMIAKRLGLNDKIIDDALLEMESKSNESSDVIKNLEDELLSVKKKEKELDEKILEQNRINKELINEKNNLIKSTDKLINEAKEKAKSIIENSKKESEKLLNEIKNLSSESYKEHEMINLKTKMRNLDIQNEESVIKDTFNVGDFVLIKTYEKYGTVSKVKKDNTYTVNIGQFQMDFKGSELILSAKPVEKPKPKQRLSGYNPTSHVGLSLDLRGKRVEEVNYLLEQYFDQALLGNLDQVSIIHGFGTGAVRKAVQEFLKNKPYVKSYRYGGEGEGLNGVTIVYLK